MTQPEESGGEKKKGHPEWGMKIDCTPEELAQAIFATIKPPDPSLRKPNRLPDDTSERK